MRVKEPVVFTGFYGAVANCEIPAFVDASLSLAKRKNQDVVFISDNPQARKYENQGIRVQVYETPTVEVTRFLSTWENRSNQADWLVSTWFTRFLYLHHYMVTEEFPTCWLLDTDVLCFTDLSRLSALLASQNSKAALSTPPLSLNLEASSPHTSWWTVDALASFCEFLLNTPVEAEVALARKWQLHQKAGLDGGVIDMTYLFYWQSKRNDVSNLYLRQIRGILIDHQVQLLQAPAGKFAKSSITGLRNLIPWFHGLVASRLRGGRIPKAFATLHLQGEAKTYLHLFAAWFGHVWVPDSGANISRSLGLLASAQIERARNRLARFADRFPSPRQLRDK